MILIDPPAWPAHGTLFSHLVSDSHLAELHRFAQENHISPKAFDWDHYDVPAEIYDQLIAAGAQAVSGAELTRRLIKSGLRVPLKERPTKIRGLLLERWQELVPGQAELGEHILDQWEESSRGYHNSAHLLEMLNQLNTFYLPATPPRAVLLAAWLHDVIYDAQPGRDEEKSANFARDVLMPLIASRFLEQVEVDAAVQLIEATVSHEAVPTPGLSTLDIQYFMDADLAIFAAAPPRYQRYVAGVRQEYSRFSDAEFFAGRRAILEDFLEREHIFATDKARGLYEKRARLNIENELASYS